MIRELLSHIRDRSISTQDFRITSHLLSEDLARQTISKISEEKHKDIILVLILRSSFAMLPAFLKLIPHAPVGVIGLVRDEVTALPHKYYENIPKIEKDSIIVIPDPMLATGGSLSAALEILGAAGAQMNNIYYTGFLGAKEGVERIKKVIPESHMTLLAIDDTLDTHKYIVPGLGDFGDRYFGYTK